MRADILGTCSNAACPRAIDIADYPRYNLLLLLLFPLIILIVPSFPRCQSKTKMLSLWTWSKLLLWQPPISFLFFLSPRPLSLCTSLPPPALPSVAVTRHEIDLFQFCVKCRAQNSKKKKTKKKPGNFSFLRLLV